VVWDEDNLIYNESNKSATMKIDEPPTPYNKEYDSGEEDEEESTSSSEKEKGGGGEGKSDDDGERTSSATRRNHNREEIKTEEDSRAHFDQVSTALEESKRRPAARPRFSSDEDTTEDDEGADHGISSPLLLSSSDLSARVLCGVHACEHMCVLCVCCALSVCVCCACEWLVCALARELLPATSPGCCSAARRRPLCVLYG
jgi:hypothetical protein